MSLAVLSRAVAQDSIQAGEIGPDAKWRRRKKLRKGLSAMHQAARAAGITPRPVNPRGRKIWLQTTMDL